MEGVVAKRTLKRSYYENNNVYTREVADEKENSKEKTTIKEKILFKLSLQAVTTVAIFSFVALVQILQIEVVLNSDIVNGIKKEWKNNWSLEEIQENIIDSINNAYAYIEPIVPDKIEEFLKNKIYEKKQHVKETENNEVKIYEETSDSKSESEEKNEIEINNGIGASVDNVITAMSSISYEETIAEKIKKTGVTFVKPLSGTITSNFGAREEIFDDIDSYHTGIDIAANTGTKVVSSINGKVTVTGYNKYNGNYVEVTKGDIVTKYCHLSKISVKKGASIKAGAKIGEVGSTGYSTGPHLHFEIVYKGTKIDPRLLVKF